MKTSNKLLIAFGLTLVLLPILTMAIISRVYMAEGAATDLSSSTRHMTTLPMSAPFSNIHIEGDNRMAVVVEIVKDDKYGVKIPDDAGGHLNAQIGEDGQLNIVIKNPVKAETYSRRIIIYAPNVKALTIDNVKILNLSASLDSLKLTMNNAQSLWIEGDGLIQNLVATTNNVGGFGINNGTVASATLDLTNTSFTSRTSKMEQLSITTKGNSEINIEGENGDAQPVNVIKDLTLNTLGKTSVKISDVQINNCSGSFSDSTAVEMPAVNINQMFKIKK
ncbi:hypothetical protein ACXZ1K_18565 [Pedobacter sp. PWIIR3]